MAIFVKSRMEGRLPTPVRKKARQIPIRAAAWSMRLVVCFELHMSQE